MSVIVVDRYGAAEKSSEGERNSPYKGRSFRPLDLVLSIICLIFFSPLMALLGLAVWVQDGESPLYGQKRIGLDGRLFTCWKFRSMFVDSGDRLRQILLTDTEAQREWAANHKLKSDPRVTPLGDFLRKSSLDELPQLFNVVVGDMGLVGPRPIVAAEAEKYGRYFKHYCSVPPGITGLWQVSGRSDVSYRRRVAMDVAYARSKSMMLDIRLLAATIPTVLMRKGSY
jgi:lipopolysaccharide/colanic/teichoic acid biosynthesis glycosyltransferase